jgi:drug/metabolite transporter (DMT)-like permease
MNSLWIVFTVIAALGQTVRNTMQRDLTGDLGATGATHVRFLFGLPFALLFLLGVVLAKHVSLPHPPPLFWVWVLAGALTQILATLLMLLTMKERSFLVSIAFLKTEPVIVALLGLMFLGDRLSITMWVAIAIASFGMVLVSMKPKTGLGSDRAALRAALLGLTSGALFAGSAVGFRGAILLLPPGDFLLSATYTLVLGLVMQAVLLSTYLALRAPGTLTAMFAAWPRTLRAGIASAITSEFWLLAFALATAASVRTLGLVDIVFAHAVSHFWLRQKTSPREAVGIVILIAGALLLVWAQP